MSRGEPQRSRTHCPKGHEYTTDNTSVSGGKRTCKTCHRLYYDPIKRKERTLEQYDLTVDDYNGMLVRQGGRCLGCQELLEATAVIDHNHETSKVRGVLCSNCNTALGMTKDSAETLRRLAAYLSYDITKTHGYVIGSLRNPKVVEVGDALRSMGYDIFDEWQAAGPEADSYWQTYEQGRGHTFEEALLGRAAQNVYHFDRAHLDLSDFAVLVLPAGKSGHLELGYMAGRNKRTYILLDGEPDRYDVMPNFADGVYTNIEELLNALHS